MSSTRSKRRRGSASASTADEAKNGADTSSSSPRASKRQRKAQTTPASGSRAAKLRVAAAGAGAGAGAGSSAASGADSPAASSVASGPASPITVLGPIPTPTCSAIACLDSDDMVVFASEEETARQRELQREIIRKRGKQPIRIYADGIYDMFHYGHARALEQAKKLFPNVHLIVGCCNDEMTHRLKGRTVMRDVERYESLRGCKWVDEVVKDAPWVITQEFLDEHDIDFVCHDAEPYVGAGDSATKADIYDFVKAQGRFLGTRRTGGVSTTGIIVRIIQDYDVFVRRNLTRGMTGKEMNVPFMKEKAIKFDMAMDKAKKSVESWRHNVGDKTKEVFEEVGERVGETFHNIWGEAEELQHAFVSLFSKEGGLRTKLRKTRRNLASRISALARDSLM